MIIFRTISLIMFIQLLCSCAATRDASKVARVDSKTTFNEYGEKCSHPNQDLFTITTSYITEDTGKKSTFYDEVPVKTFSSMESLSFENNKLTISFIEKKYLEEYVAPINNIILVKKREARPGLGITAGVGSLGLFPILGSNNFSEVTFGCTDKELWKTEINKDKKLKTGNFEWKNNLNRLTHDIKIKVSDKEYEYVVQISKNLTTSIDMKSILSDLNLKNDTKLVVECFDCNLLSYKEQSLFKNSKKIIVLDQDLSNIDFINKNDNDYSSQKQNDYAKTNEFIKKPKNKKYINSNKNKKIYPINDPLNIRFNDPLNIR
jgi:hypothetical protein